MSYGVVSVTAETDCSLTVPISVTAVSGKTTSSLYLSLSGRQSCKDRSTDKKTFPAKRL